MDEARSGRIRRWRLGRVRDALGREGLAAALIFDPIHLRYATGARNMQVWTMHSVCRYALVFAAGPVILFELPAALHFSEGIPEIDERRPSLAWDYMMVGARADEMAGRAAAEIADLMATHGGGERRLGLDRMDPPLAHALAGHNLEIRDARGPLERARAIKSPDEITSLRESLATTAAAIDEMRAGLRPGAREEEALAALIGAQIARGGEYPETRLLTSGPRTNPWFQETGSRVMVAGDLISFDTDLIGPEGWYCDLSRSFTVGETRPNDEQRRLYGLARAQLEHNMALIRPGAGFLEISEKAYRLPEDCLPQRYADIGHGCGLAVEYPLLWYREDLEWGAYDGVVEPGMVICVEAYVGPVGGREGVKLEQPLLVTDRGAELLSDYPLEDDWA